MFHSVAATPQTTIIHRRFQSGKDFFVSIESSLRLDQHVTRLQ